MSYSDYLLLELNLYSYITAELLYAELLQYALVSIAMHKVIKEFQKFFRNNRLDGEKYEVTPYSLRHAYAQKEYESLLKKSRNKKYAKKTVSQDTGYNRLEVTDIF